MRIRSIAPVVLALSVLFLPPDFVGIVALPSAMAQYKQVQLPLTALPEEHAYQKKIRAFLATLSEKDFEVESKRIELVEPANDEERYKLWLLSIHPPQLYGLRNPAAEYTLASIESQPSLKMPTPPPGSQMLAWLAKWDYPGNPYRGSRALKLRAFTLAAVDLVMLDYLYEHDPRGADRADYLGGNMIWMGFTYGVVKDILPKDVQHAVEEGLKKHVLRINRWGPKGQMTDMDLFAPVGLWYIQSALDDPEVSKVAKEYSRQLFTDPHYFNSAGYFVDNGCFDTSYNGISLYFSSWASLLTDWDFVDTAVDRAFRLRAHLCFPDPDGGRFVGPSAMSSRTSGDPPSDQWNFPYRPLGTAMATDESLYLASTPTADMLKSAPAAIVGNINTQLDQPYKAPEKPIPWSESHWSGYLNFPYECYKPGYITRRQKLEAEKSPLLQPLYLRPEKFVRQFDKAFVIAKFDNYAAAIHTGPVGRPVGHGGRPYGYGGGGISVYWTPETGAVMAARRRGVQGAVFDTYEEWRDQPVHAVSGLTPDNELVTTTRIVQPDLNTDVAKDRASITVSGNAPKYNPQRASTTPSGLNYERTMAMENGGLRVKTTVTSDGKETFAELWETIPVYIRDAAERPATTIQFQTGGAWADAKPGKTASVTAVKLSRFKGAVMITFTKPVAIDISEKNWRDGFQTQAECRNLRVDLLAGATAPAKIKTQTVEYTISAAK